MHKYTAATVANIRIGFVRIIWSSLDRVLHQVLYETGLLGTV
jgi:hypothetical protein